MPMARVAMMRVHSVAWRSGPANRPKISQPSSAEAASANSSARPNGSPSSDWPISAM
ncbi:Uncharacterised protein [Bordetella pertussis]|nr:Uncharacterised protein [Bordetella pertussis]